ncbi:MAG: HPr-rel-A system PqqD family peptide chaperone [Colwellia sp.]|nr:HPr-rel-A system PqqD family peptide chaperone [Colwellia sp.]MCW8866310.1 HPr-rel-A system PqqD family peptide chaperone [Colwellia sp.]MCW9080668.1 HPr-rel-A system PqqD family peptide chaperone [Colwellia sp.]
MKIIKVGNLLTKHYDEHVIVFDPNTGQTHCLDSNVNEVLNHLPTNKPYQSSQLKQFFMQDCANDEKTMLNDYIQDMIDNLLQLKLIRAYSL